MSNTLINQPDCFINFYDEVSVPKFELCSNWCLAKNEYWYAVSAPYTFQPAILKKMNKIFLNSDDLPNISKEFLYKNDKREGKRLRLF